MSRNERTSPRVAKIAAKVLACSATPDREIFHYYEQYSAKRVSVTWRDIRALAASALTQAPDRRDPPYAYEVSPSEHRKKFPYNVPTKAEKVTRMVAAKPKRRAK